ncbi:MAG: hypothetical protein Q9212_001659 [Teloschistes hypoglaucus]
MFEKLKSSEEAALGIEADPNQTPTEKTNEKPITAAKVWADCGQKQKAVDTPSTSTLIISQSLAHSNYASPRPCPIDPSVFFDLVRVRRLVEEATDLAVRAANGTTSSSLRSSLHAGNNLVKGGGNGAAALGLTFGGTAHTKLSRERKHRMRDLATQKLSYAYQLDEIAASVATMQSTSSLEDVAKLVLQRNPDDSDAKYVHFFHEKIPSRMLDESTNLQPLNEIVHARPTDGALLRTRAITKIFKNDLPGAVEDLTEALAICRYMAMQHKGGLGLSSAIPPVGKSANGSREPGYSSKKDDEANPSSLEPQLLFHRAGVYLTLACNNIPSSLDQPRPQAYLRPDSGSPQTKTSSVNPTSSAKPLGSGPMAQKLVKSYAKRALRDYLGFLAFFEYTPGMPIDLTRTNSPKPGKENHATENRGSTMKDGLHEAPKDPEALQTALTRVLPSYKQKADKTVRQTDNWIGLEQSWDNLCAPAPLPGHTDALVGQESLGETREYQWQEAVMESLADERVQDQATFQAAVTARERRANDTGKDLTGPKQPEAKRWAHGDNTVFPVGSERAAAIVRWVIEAPSSIPSSRKPKRGRKRPQVVPGGLS